VTYEFHPAAEIEHLDNVTFYESLRAGLGTSYLAQFEAAMEIVCANPHRFPVEQLTEIRRIRLKGFPFTILFRQSGSMVQVLAVAHYRRRPQYWFGRFPKIS
jgi:toxin ParE1/3/4